MQGCHWCHENKIECSCRQCWLEVCKKCEELIRKDRRRQYYWCCRHQFIDINYIYFRRSFVRKPKEFKELHDLRCIDHGPPYSRYCKTCDKFICIRCWKDHKEHDLLRIFKLVKNDYESEIKRELDLQNELEIKKNYIVTGIYTTHIIGHIASVVNMSFRNMWTEDWTTNKLIYWRNRYVKSIFDISVKDIAIISPHELLISTGESQLKLLNGNTGKLTNSQYDVAPLIAYSIHIDRNQRFIIGATSPGPMFPISGRRLVKVFDKEGYKVTEYEHDSNGKPLFSFPYKITSTSNGNIFVIDFYSKENEPDFHPGRVVVIGQTGNILQIYAGHGDVNLRSNFMPRSIITTPLLDNVILADSLTHSLHILNNEGQILTCCQTFRLDHDMLFPYALAFSRPEHIFISCLYQRSKLYEVKYSGFF